MGRWQLLSSFDTLVLQGSRKTLAIKVSRTLTWIITFHCYIKMKKITGPVPTSGPNPITIYQIQFSLEER